MAEEQQTTRTKDLPILDSVTSIADNDRLFSVYLIANTNYKASFGITVSSMVRGILLAMLENGTVNSRYGGVTDPDPDLGINGDLYFIYLEDEVSITGIFVKYADEWQRLL